MEEAGDQVMTNAANPGRAAILERIRAGLRETAPEAAGERPQDEIFAPVTDPLERFLAECKSNLMECLLTEDAAESAHRLIQVLNSLPAGEVFAQDHPTLRQLLAGSDSSRPVRWSSQGRPAETSQATVTMVEAIVAQTGSIFVSASCGGRGASIVAPCHIAFATVSQLVPDLATLLRQASQRNILTNNSFACVISGSSRTADIEKILVQGAHGPRRLVVILQKG
jgi:L-lactate dehydrogenase complex protein LldG